VACNQSCNFSLWNLIKWQATFLKKNCLHLVWTFCSFWSFD
jgi:hypothetical protein